MKNHLAMRIFLGCCERSWPCAAIALALFCGTSSLLAPVSGDPCSPFDVCSLCLQNNQCTWCNDPNNYKCILASANNSCEEGYIVDFQNVIKVKEGNDIFGPSQSNSKGTVFISPQKLSLQLKVNTPINVTIKAKVVMDQPIDLYWLMDANQWMFSFDFKKRWHGVESLRLHAGFNTLPFLQSISTDVKIGYGTFICKLAKPFAIYCSSCGGANGESWALHPFLNMIKLTGNLSWYQEQMKDLDPALVSHFQDGWYVPELDALTDASDALVQAAVCRRSLGWRVESRKVLLLCTNQMSYWEPDGKVKARLTRRNDGMCHVDKSGYDVGSSKMDFPSRNLVKEKLSENSINAVFASYMEAYAHWASTAVAITEAHRLTERGKELVVEIAKDQIPITPMLADQLDKIKRTIELRAKGIDEVNTTFSSDCNSGKTHDGISNRCYDLQYEKEVTFEAQIVLNKCPEDPKKWRQNLVIQPEDSGKTLVIEVEMLCDCCTQIPGYEDEKCPRQCDGLEACVECLSKRVWKDDVDCGHECGSIKYNDIQGEKVEELDESTPPCEGVQSFKLTFSYLFNKKGQVEVTVKKKMECEEQTED